MYPEGLQKIVDSFKNTLAMPDTSALLTVLGAVAGSRIEKGTGVHMFLIGPPASGKNQILESLFGIPSVQHISTVSGDAAFISGVAKKDRSTEATGGLLMKVGIGGVGTWVFTEFNSVLSMRQEKRAEVLAAIREICTGFWDRQLGGEGGASFHWHGKVSMFAGCTEAIEEHGELLNQMGERFSYVHMPKMNRRDHIKAVAASRRQGKSQADATEERRRAVTEYFAGLRVPMTPEFYTDDDDFILGSIANFATLARSAVPRDRRTREVERIYEAEGPARLMHTLSYIFSGLKIIGIPRDEAIRLIGRVGLGCIPMVRRGVIAAMVDAMSDDGAVMIRGITEKLGSMYSDMVVKRAVEELEIHHICRRLNGSANHYTLTEQAFEDFTDGFDLTDTAWLYGNAYKNGNG